MDEQTTYFIDRIGNERMIGIVEWLEVPRFVRPWLKILFDGLSDIRIQRGNDLRTVLPIDFVSVVILGIVTGCDHDARVTMQLSNGKWNERCWNGLRIEQVDMDRFMRKESGSQTSELMRLMPSIEADHHG